MTKITIKRDISEKLASDHRLRKMSSRQRKELGLKGMHELWGKNIGGQSRNKQWVFMEN